ncbi:TerD family protein [Kitasatospora sp. GP82]|uniref:TerD family protein n=1 Tax=Kitasatospora sp. GP82 TaxID=3035089 RepID=UPI0024756F9B|nr:TerD family protein [Kitasatospora sp. GP82]MDH6126732.1 stress response protein SCP2 [Kitasatospora sp. GP82]
MTHVMAKGANISLTAAAVRAVLRWSAAPGTPDVDASALLLGSAGKVRSDVDFVFYNQPLHPSGTVRHQPKQQTPDGGEVWDTVEVDLAQLPPEVDRVVLAGSAEGGSFPAVRDLRVVLYEAGTGAGDAVPPIAEFTVTDTGDVTALIAAELYRRNGAWKFRAIGQGYATGLGALATEYGVTVEDDDAAQPDQQHTAPAAPEASPATTRPDPRDEPGTYTLAPATPLPQAAPPVPPTAPPMPPLPPQQSPQQQAPQQQPGYGYPPPPPHAPQPTYGYQQQPYAAPTATGYSYPPQAQPQPGYGYPPQPQPQPPHPNAYGHPQAPTQPPQQVPYQPQPPAPPQSFALPPQGPQFQPR